MRVMSLLFLASRRSAIPEGLSFLSAIARQPGQLEATKLYFLVHLMTRRPVAG
jgi:hypothetical protein